MRHRPCHTLPLVHFISRTMCETFIEKENQVGVAKERFARGVNNPFCGKHFIRDELKLVKSVSYIIYRLILISRVKFIVQNI